MITAKIHSLNARNKQSKEIEYRMTFSAYDYKDDMAPLLLKYGGNYIATAEEAKTIRDANLKRLNDPVECEKLRINEYHNVAICTRWGIASVRKIIHFFDNFNENVHELIVGYDEE